MQRGWSYYGDMLRDDMMKNHPEINIVGSQTEEEYIRFLCNDGHALGISRGYVSGGALHIMDGFLKRFQHKIIRFNRRGKRAVADVTIYGRHYEVILGCEIESQPAVPLISSGTAKNIS